MSVFTCLQADHDGHMPDVCNNPESRCLRYKSVDVHIVLMHPDIDMLWGHQFLDDLPCAMGAGSFQCLSMPGYDRLCGAMPGHAGTCMAEPGMPVQYQAWLFLLSCCYLEADYGYE